jgi:hypothetical protein
VFAAKNISAASQFPFVAAFRSTLKSSSQNEIVTVSLLRHLSAPAKTLKYARIRHNSFRISSYAKRVCNPPGMSSYKNKGLKVPVESTVTKKGGRGGVNPAIAAKSRPCAHPIAAFPVLNSASRTIKSSRPPGAPFTHPYFAANNAKAAPSVCNAARQSDRIARASRQEHNAHIESRISS